MLESTRTSEEIGEGLEFLLSNGADTMLTGRDRAGTGNDPVVVLPVHVAIKYQCELFKAAGSGKQVAALRVEDGLPRLETVYSFRLKQFLNVASISIGWHVPCQFPFHSTQIDVEMQP